jgi:hypothetical protein
MSTLSTAARNAACDAVVDLVDAGSGAGKVRIRASSTLLAEITLADPAFGAASTGVATGASFPRSDTSADASGTADNYQILDSDNNVIISGTVGEGSGDISLDNTDIAAGQTVTLTSLTHTQPAS